MLFYTGSGRAGGIGPHLPHQNGRAIYHEIGPFSAKRFAAGDELLLRDLRALWGGKLILNRPGRTRKTIGADLASGMADLESYVQVVLANLDFVERLRVGTPLNTAERAEFFGGGAEGYTDYPTPDAVMAA